VCTGLAYSPDGRRLAFSGFEIQGEVYVVEAEDGGPVATFRAAGAIGNLTFSPDGSLLAVCALDTDDVLWDTKSWKPVAAPRARGASIKEFCFSHDGKALAILFDYGECELWDLGTGKRRRIGAVDVGPRTPAFSPADRRVAAVDCRGTVAVWDRSGELLWKFEAHEDVDGERVGVHGIAFASEGVFLTAGVDDHVRWWDIDAKKEIDSYDAGMRVTTFAYHAGRGLVALGSGSGQRNPGVLHVIDARTKRLVLSADCPAGAHRLAFRPDGKVIAVGPGTGATAKLSFHQLEAER
jgi:WD40 repeat protein